MKFPTTSARTRDLRTAGTQELMAWGRGENGVGLIAYGGEKRPLFVKRISFQIRLTEGMNDERGEPNDESAGRPTTHYKMLDRKICPNSSLTVREGRADQHPRLPGRPFRA